MRPRLVVRLTRPVLRDRAHLGPRFALRSHEVRFALRTLDRCPQVWLFRCHQQRFCGDFVAVDMSAASPHRRRVVPIELKQRTALVVGSRHHQLGQHPDAVAEIAASTGIVDEASPVVPLFGAPAEVRAFLARER